MKAVKKIVLAASMCAMVASMAQANVISWNMNVFGDSPTGASPLSGVVPAGYWTDTYLNNNSSNLVDSTGAATTMDIGTVDPNGTYAIQFAHPGNDTDGSLNKEIINGYMNAGGGTQSAISLAQIPYASYDIYLYFSSDTAGRQGSATDGTSTYYFNTLGAASIASGNALLTQATDTTTNGYSTAANYAVFSGLTGSSQTVSVDIPAYGGIAAIQVVQTIPEPATLGLIGFFGAGILFVRRRIMM